MDQQLMAKMAVVQQYTQDAPDMSIADLNGRQGMGYEQEHIPVAITVDDVYVVWYAYVLGGWKCLISTTVPDNKYYEVTYNAAKREMYVDTYIKMANAAVRGD